MHHAEGAEIGNGSGTDDSGTNDSGKTNSGTPPYFRATSLLAPKITASPASPPKKVGHWPRKT